MQENSTDYKQDAASGFRPLGGVCGEKIQGLVPNEGSLTSSYPDPHKMPPYAGTAKESF